MSIDPSTLPYRPCVGIMVLNADGLVWTGRRSEDGDPQYRGTQRLWQMPQGGIDEGEDAERAARRELYEETGIHSVRLLDSTDDWLTYELPPAVLGKALKGRFRGQKQRWFAYRFEGPEEEIRVSPPPDGHPAEFDGWQWREMQELPALIVEFKRELYEQVVARFAHLARAAG